MDLRFPIGPMPTLTEVSAEQRSQLIADLASLPEALRKAVAGLTEDQLDTPYRPDGWTVRQVVHHVPDSHMNAYIRFKLALTEPRPTIKPYAEARWAELPDTAATPIATSLDLLANLHQRWVILLRALGDNDFERTFVHPDMEQPVALKTALGMYAWHGKHHVAHVTALCERMGW